MFRKRTPEVENLTFTALIELKQAVDRAVATRQEAEIETLKSKALAPSAALGIPLAELFGVKVEAIERKTKRAPRIKYRDPDNPASTWTGKGRTPKWLQEKFDQGASKEEFLVG